MRVVLDAAGALSPDPRRRAPGRGAWVHCDEQCLRTALDRRALHRALRTDGTFSDEEVSGLWDALRARAREQTRNGPDTMSTP